MKNILTGLLVIGCICLAAVAMIEWKQMMAQNATINGLESQVRGLASEVQTLSSHLDYLDFQVKAEQSRDPKRDELFEVLQGRLEEARGQWREVKGYRARIMKCLLDRSSFDVSKALLTATVEHTGAVRPGPYELELAFEYKQGKWQPVWNESGYRFRKDDPEFKMTPDVREWFSGLIERNATASPP